MAGSTEVLNSAVNPCHVDRDVVVAEEQERAAGCVNRCVPTLRHTAATDFDETSEAGQGVRWTVLHAHDGLEVVMRVRPRDVADSFGQARVADGQ